LLSPGVEPAEALARVCVVKPSETAARSEQPAAAVIRQAEPNRSDEIEEMRRRVDWFESYTGRAADVEAIIQAMQAELYPTRLRELRLR
jgi:hypothetical protein